MSRSVDSLLVENSILLRLSSAVQLRIGQKLSSAQTVNKAEAAALLSPLFPAMIKEKLALVAVLLTPYTVR